MRIGFFGTGHMGAPIVRNLLRHGFEVAVWNRTPAKYTDLLEAGATAPGTPRAVAEASDVLVAMLVEPAHLDAILHGANGILAGLNAGSMFLDLATGPPRNAQRLEQLFAERAVAFMDAPVRGGVAGAADGSLLVMAGGRPETFARARPLFEAIGRTIVHVGPAGSGQLAKLCHQIVAIVSVQAIAEAMALAQTFGAEQTAVREVLLNGVCTSPLLRTDCDRIIARNWQLGRPLWFYLKDAVNLDATLETMDLELPLAQATFDRIRALVRDGHSDLDESSLYTLLGR